VLVYWDNSPRVDILSPHSVPSQPVFLLKAKKTVTWTNEIIEDLIDFIEIHPIVAFEAIYEPMLTSFWSLIPFVVQLYIIMQYKARYTRYKFGIQVAIQEDLNSSLCMHDARNFDEYTQVLAWPIRRQNPYQHQFVNVNNNNYVLCKDGGKRGNSKMQEKDSHME
jgi:hypothetical protein